MQDFNDKLADEYESVTEKKVDKTQQRDIEFGLKVVKHVKIKCNSSSKRWTKH